MSKHNSEIADREGKMINFIDAVEKTEKKQQGLDKLKQSPQSKLTKIKKCKEDAKKECVDYVLTKIYSDALPIDNTYKGSHLDDMSMEFMDYINNKEEKGLPLYVHEASKKGSEFAKILTESVDALVNDYFREASVDPSSVDYDDIGFDIDDDTAQKGLGDISDKLNIDDISEIIKENVKKTALNDIIQAKQKNNESKQIIDELKSDESLTTESAVERALRLRGLSETEYNPNLFEGIMINKVKLITESYPDMDEIDVNSFAYCESVKELTKINVLNATNLVTFKPWENAAIGKKYAQMKVPESGISLYTENVEAELFEEGANLEIRSIYKANIKKIKGNIKSAKRSMKEKNYKESIKALEETKSLLRQMSDDIENVNDAKIGSFLFSWLLIGNIPILGRELLILNPSLGISAGIVLNKWTKRFKAIADDCRKYDRHVQVKDFNKYKSSIKIKLNEYIKFCDVMLGKLREYDRGTNETSDKIEPEKK